MRAGWLRHRIALQTATPTQNAVGEPVDAWATTATVWGSVEPLRGREYIDQATAQAAVTTRIRIRYRSGVTPQMRATWDGHTYDIQAVVEVKTQRKELELMCNEVL